MDLENFEFENIMSEKKINFSNLSLSLTTSLPSFGSNILGISSFIEFRFLNNTNHQSQPSSSNKTRQIFEFRVARSGTIRAANTFDHKCIFDMCVFSSMLIEVTLH